MKSNTQPKVQTKRWRSAFRVTCCTVYSILPVFLGPPSASSCTSSFKYPRCCALVDRCSVRAGLSATRPCSSPHWDRSSPKPYIFSAPSQPLRPASYLASPLILSHCPVISASIAFVTVHFKIGSEAFAILKPTEWVAGYFINCEVHSRPKNCEFIIAINPSLFVGLPFYVPVILALFILHTPAHFTQPCQ